MKTRVLFRFMLVLLLSASVSSMYAAMDLYISADGNDANDGFSEATPVKTLAKIQTILGIGDVIHIDGMIDISLEPKGAGVGNNENSEGFILTNTMGWQNSKMVGKDPAKDGFTAKGESRIFRINSGTHAFEKLRFTGGVGKSSGGGCALFMVSSNCTFIDCHFVENKPVDPNPTNGWGGAIYIQGGPAYNFYNCYFANNGNDRGGAIFWQGGTINLFGCIFEDNVATHGDGGGALYSWMGQEGSNPIITIDRCVFRSNAAWGGSGGVISLFNRNDRVAGSRTKMTITNSAFINNRANNGGAIFLDNSRVGTADSILIANTSFIGNVSAGDGGAICLARTQANSIFTMVNSSVIGNYTTGANSGHGAGLTIRNNNNSDMLKRFYNCIFDYNMYVGDPMTCSDIVWRLPEGVTGPGQNSAGEEELIIKNTYAGLTVNAVAWLNDDNYPGNALNYSLGEYVNAAGVDDVDYYFIQTEFPLYAIPLEDGAPARTFGNAAYLTEFGIEDSDQLGKERVIVGGACVVGAVEITPDEFDNQAFPDYPVWTDPNSTGIKNIFVPDNKNAFLVKDNIISLRDSQWQNVRIVLYNMTGKQVKSSMNQMNISDLEHGLYIAKAQAGGRVFVQKILK